MKPFENENLCCVQKLFLKNFMIHQGVFKGKNILEAG